MYILAVGLDPASAAVLEQACAAVPAALEHASGDQPVELRPDLLAAFLPARDDGQAAVTHPSVGELRAHGAHAVAVLRQVSPVATLRGVEAGFSFVLAWPLGAPRVAALLGYLRSVAVPPRARELVLDDAGMLSSPTATVALDDSESAVLRMLGARAGGIVESAAATAAGGRDAAHVVASLRDKLVEIESGAQIIKVPAVGFRLAGSVRNAAAG